MNFDPRKTKFTVLLVNSALIYIFFINRTYKTQGQYKNFKSIIFEKLITGFVQQRNFNLYLFFNTSAIYTPKYL